MNKTDAKTFDLNLDAESAVPIYDQIKNAIKMALFTGKLREGDKLVSIRDVAAQHKINPITILKAYNQLEFEGFLQSRRGAGYFIHVDREKFKKGRKEMFEREVSQLLKRTADLGYTVQDFLKELEKYVDNK